MIKQKSPMLIGLLQALGVTIYCLLMGTFFWNMDHYSNQPGSVVIIALILVLLVFSAALTGLMVFGYPAYLAMQKRIREALQILGYTFLYVLFIIIVVVFFVIL